MLNKISEYINNAFIGVPENNKVRELKDELLANLSEKYQDQIRSGKTEQEAYNAVIIGIGDLSELAQSMKDPFPLSPSSPAERNRRALFVATAIMLYIISPFVAVVPTMVFGEPIVGAALMFLLIAFATGMLIYTAMTKPSYRRSDDSIVEEFKEWRVNSENSRSAMRSFEAAYWGLVVAVYLLVSFLFRIWAYTWILFIIAAAVRNIVKGMIQLKSERSDRRNG